MLERAPSEPRESPWTTRFDRSEPPARPSTAAASDWAWRRGKIGCKSGELARVAASHIVRRPQEHPGGAARWRRVTRPRCTSARRTSVAGCRFTLRGVAAELMTRADTRSISGSEPPFR